MDLNEDCHLLILEHVNTVDLLSLAQMDAQLFGVSKIALKRKITKNEVVIRVPSDQTKLKSLADYAKDYNNNIELRHWPTIHWLLKHYGHIITSLRIQIGYELPEDEAKTMYEMINSHCSNTLIQLHITNNNDKVFTSFKKPFENVQMVSLAGSFVDNANFTKIFPLLHRLSIGAITGDKLNLQEQRMPHLEAIILTENSNDRNTNLMKELIKRNPQIKSLILHEVRPAFLQFIASELPHLEKLHITLYEEDRRKNYSLNFQYLKSFSMTCAHFPLNIILDELNELKIRTHNVESMMAVEKVIEYKKNLKKFELMVELNDKEILTLANANLNVIEMRLTCETDVNAQSIIQLIEGSKELKRLDLVFGSRKINSFTFAILKERLFDQWQITKNNYCLYLDRF